MHRNFMLGTATVACLMLLVACNRNETAYNTPANDNPPAQTATSAPTTWRGCAIEITSSKRSSTTTSASNRTIRRHGPAMPAAISCGGLASQP